MTSENNKPFLYQLIIFLRQKICDWIIIKFIYRKCQRYNICTLVALIRHLKWNLFFIVGRAMIFSIVMTVGTVYSLGKINVLFQQLKDQFFSLGNFKTFSRQGIPQQRGIRQIARLIAFFPRLLCFQKWKCQSESKIQLCFAYLFCRIPPSALELSPPTWKRMECPE